MASSVLGCNVTPYYRAQDQSLSLNPTPKFIIFKHKDQTYFHSYDHTLQRRNTNQRIFVVRASSVPPEAPFSSSSSNPIVNEIIKAMLSTIMPYLSTILAPLRIFKDKMDDAVESVEGVVNVVEEVAEKVDEVAEGILDDLPEGKLKDFVHFVENMAEETAHNADSIGDFIDEVQEEEEQLETFVVSVKNSNHSEQNNGGIGNIFDGLLPSFEMFSYF